MCLNILSQIVTSVTYFVWTGNVSMVFVKKIEIMVGKENFKSQHYIDTHLAALSTSSKSYEKLMYNAHRTWSGGYLCGGVKVALTLRWVVANTLI